MLGFWYGELHRHYNELDPASIATLYYSTDMDVSSPFTNCIYSINTYTILYQNHN